MAANFIREIGQSNSETLSGVRQKIDSVLAESSEKKPPAKNLSANQNIAFSNKSKIEIIKSPEPDDIIWSHLGVSKAEQLYRRILTFVLTVVALVASFAAIFGIKLLESKSNSYYFGNQQSEQLFKSYQYFSIIVSLVIALINYGLSYLLSKLTLEEKHMTETDHFKSLTLKIDLAQFFNTNLIVIIVHVFNTNQFEAIYTRSRCWSN